VLLFFTLTNLQLRDELTLQAQTYHSF